MWLGLLDLGISAGMNVQAAQLTGKPDDERLNRLASTAFFSQVVISLVILVVGVLLSQAFPRFFAIRPDLQQDAAGVLALMTIGTAMNMGVQVFSALLIAHQQIHIDNLIKLSLIVVRTLLTVVLLLAGWGIFSLAVANLAAVSITAVLAVLRTYRLLPGLRIRWRYFNWEVLKSTGSLGIWFSLGGIAGIVITSLDRIVTAKLISVEMVTTLSLTGRLYGLANGVLQQITNSARPAMGQLFGKQKIEEAHRLYRQLFALSSGSAIVIAAGLWAANGAFVPWWVSAENYGGIGMDAALALNMEVHAWILPNRATLTAALELKKQTISRIIESFLNLALGILLARYLGVVGIVISTSIAAILTSTWYLPMITARMFRVPFLDLIRGDFSKLLIMMVGLAPAAYGVRQWSIAEGGLFRAGLAGGVIWLAGVLALWFYVFDRNLRQRILQGISGFAPSLTHKTAK